MATNSFPNLNVELAIKMAKLEAMIQCIPGVLMSIMKITANYYADSPFLDDIHVVEMPRRFNFPNMKSFDGTTDPNNHIAKYQQWMFTLVIPLNMRKACMCRRFGSSLVRPVLPSYTNFAYLHLLN